MILDQLPGFEPTSILTRMPQAVGAHIILVFKRPYSGGLRTSSLVRASDISRVPVPCPGEVKFKGPIWPMFTRTGHGLDVRNPFP